MENENDWLDLDRRVANALKPDTEAVRRVLDVALRERSQPKWRARAPRTIAVAATLAALAAGAIQWLRPAAPVSAGADLTITGTGSSILVERADGQRWFFGEPPDPDSSGGSYVIVIRKPGASR